MDSENLQLKPLFLEDKGEINDMPGIKKRQDGRYEIRKMFNGQRVSYYTNTIEEAKKIYRKLKSNKLPVSKEISPKKLTTLEWINQWMDTYKKNFITKKSFRDIYNSLTKFIKKFGSVYIENLNTTSIQTFLNETENNRTKDKMQIYINAFLQKAEDLSIIKKNPFRAIQKTKKKKYKNYCYTYNEQCLILNAIKDTNIEHEILTYLLTGARPSELPSEKNFDFINNIITIEGTKNENAKHREIQMSTEFSRYMQKYLSKNKMLKYEDVQKQFKNLCEQINIQKPLLYRLRHTFASNHFKLGTPAKQVAEWMGHSSISLTLDTYTDIDKTITKDKIKMLYNNYYYTE